MYVQQVLFSIALLGSLLLLSPRSITSNGKSVSSAPAIHSCKDNHPRAKILACPQIFNNPLRRHRAVEAEAQKTGTDNPRDTVSLKDRSSCDPVCSTGLPPKYSLWAIKS